jgi:hypothetical protein
MKYIKPFLDMRYIKMFETFNSEKYYRKITTYEDSVAEPIDMTEKTMYKIKNLFKGSDENGDTMTDPDVEIKYGKYLGSGRDRSLCCRGKSF